MEDPRCSSHIHNLINAIKTCSRQPNENDQSKIKTLKVNEIRTAKLKEPEQPLEDKFKDLHLNIPVLEILAHALMYNAILDKYVEILELGKNGFAFIQDEMPKKVGIPNYSPCLLKIGLLEEIDHVFGLADGTKSYPVGIVKNVEVHIGRQPNENDQSKIKTLKVNEIRTAKLKEPEQPLEDKFKDLHLNIPVLEILAHALMYNAILDKYVEILELGKNGFAFIQDEMPKKVGIPNYSPCLVYYGTFLLTP
nr:hypothetical protein [Tanacetum cinerariifolium]